MFTCIKKIMQLKLVFALLLVANTVHAADTESTWEAPPVKSQLDIDNTIVPVGKGAIFCPVMSNVEFEPMYGVLNNGRIRQEARMGRRIIVNPGVYTVVYGSGTTDQMMKKKVKVVEGATTAIKPDWSALIVEVINESRADIREYYELYDMVSGDSYGIGQGVEEGLDENLRTWILPPGIYKVVKPGDNVNAVINFGTIRLLPGEMVRTNLVIETDSGNFLGFGHMADVRQTMQRRQSKWRTRSELSGNALLNYVPTEQSGEDKGVDFTATLQWLTDARYESGRHIIPFWSNLEEGLSMDEDREINKYIDKAELRLTYIFRLSNFFSPYVRATVESRLFETNHHFENPVDFALVNSLGDTVSVARNTKTLKLADAFSPIYFKQGFGITSFLIKSIPVNLNLRSGYGARQVLARDARIFDTTTNTLSPIVETDLTGVEFLCLGDFRIGRYVLFNAEFDILMPKSNNDKWIFDGENRLRLNLSSNVSLLFKMEYWKDESVNSMQTRYQTLLRFSKYL